MKRLLGLRRLGTLLIVGGALLFMAGAAGLARLHIQEGAQAAPAWPTPPHTQAPGATSTILYSPTAAAAATRVRPPTPVPTAGPPAARPGAPVRLEIPALGLDTPVAEIGWHLRRVGNEVRGEWDTVASAAGHHRGSADPGRPGNCVLSGHSSEGGRAVFRRLGELAVGDAIILHTVDGRRYEYVVTDRVLVDETGATPREKREHARWLDPTAEPVVTLVTCWPAWSYTHRLIVRAELRTP